MPALARNPRPWLPFVVISVCAVIWFGCEALQDAINKGGGAGGSGPDDKMPEAEWVALKAAALANLQVAPGWSAPVLVPGAVNSTGWEDSAQISPDGSALYFCYLPADFHSLMAKAGGDLNQFGRFKRGPARGNTPDFAFDTFVARRQGAAFAAPTRHFLSEGTNPPHSSETGAMEAEGAFWFSSNAPASATDFDTDIHRIVAGRPSERLSFNTDADENDPAYRNGELFFWSEKRPGSIAGRKAIFVVRQKGEGWTEAVALPDPVNRAGTDSWQPHLTADGRLLFTSNREGPLAIYASQRTGEHFGAPAKLVSVAPGGAALGVAEPSMTDDGKELYFVILFANAQGAHDLDIAVTRRLP